MSSISEATTETEPNDLTPTPKDLVPTPKELLQRINGLTPRKEDIDEASRLAPQGTVLYCDRYDAPRIFKYIPTFPGLPSDILIGGDYVYFYGFATTQETLQSIFFKHSHMVGRCTSSSLLIHAALGLHILQRKLVRYEDTHFVNGEVDDLAMQEPGLIVDIDGKKMLRIVAVACTQNMKFFYRRPSLKQMRLFQKHLGCEPRWFKDVVPSSEFYGWSEEYSGGSLHVRTIFARMHIVSYTSMFLLAPRES
ncbi:uncharacterized protein EV420DRAFT_1750254 [Desarmillaria tabescens]|uniref:Uncharacterized protein n=1 Tax=Armillaria tabescens TaxID=1929756 RepID=A0AA39K0P5_ARMTA|nr:uncharacterized protein EV420DRAFT_1750254 [Desarmillaria tabescens]KAK0451241.1 hypothetical protein EV420DRAFT_1750254 [Desarmillaria tabescens]